jgi:hypothetical protein
MRPRLRRRTMVVWSSSAMPAGRPAGRGGTRPSSARRFRRGLRIGVLLTILGILWLARTTRTRWEPACLLAGGALTVTGFILPAIGAFFAGLLVLIVTLLTGIAIKGRDAELAEWRS